MKRISADGPSSFHSNGIDQLSCSRTPNSLDQARLFVRPDMVSKCLIILLSAVRPTTGLDPGQARRFAGFTVVSIR